MVWDGGRVGGSSGTLGSKISVSPQLLLYLSCTAFNTYLMLAALVFTPSEYFSAVDISAFFLTMVAPWVAFSFMEVKKTSIHYLFAIVYSLFLTFYIYVLTEYYVSTRGIWDYPITVLIANIWDDAVSVVLLGAAGYYSYRAAVRSTFNVRFSAKIVTGVLFLFFGIIYMRALTFSTTIHSLLLTAVFLTLSSINALSAFIEIRRREKYE